LCLQQQQRQEHNNTVAVAAGVVDAVAADVTWVKGTNHLCKQTETKNSKQAESLNLKKKSKHGHFFKNSQKIN